MTVALALTSMILFAAAVTCDAQVSGGLELRLAAPGKNTETLTETESMLYLQVSIQNLSDSSASVDLTQATYDFEYEIDGTWYAFEPMPPVRTPLTVMLADSNYRVVRSSLQMIAPGGSTWTILTLPLAGRSPALQLHSVTSRGPGTRFEPRPGRGEQRHQCLVSHAGANRHQQSIRGVRVVTGNAVGGAPIRRWTTRRAALRARRSGASAASG
jgi:hypothetical protein